MSLICQREVLNLDDFQFSYFDMDLQEGSEKSMISLTYLNSK